MKAVIFNNFKEECSSSQISETMTVGQLIDWLRKNFDDELPIYISNYGGYSYSSIMERQFKTIDLDELN